LRHPSTTSGRDAKQGAFEKFERHSGSPICPELLPPDKQGTFAQKTEELVGPYELHDFFYSML
jgi:hypothetical protein